MTFLSTQIKTILSFLWAGGGLAIKVVNDSVTGIVQKPVDDVSMVFYYIVVGSLVFVFVAEKAVKVWRDFKQLQKDFPDKDKK